MIPAPSRTWRVGTDLPVAWLHPAARLGAGLLAVLSALLLPLPLLLPLAGLLSWLLWRTGWQPAGLWTRWRVWMPFFMIVLGAHTLSSVDAAPLGTPTWIGLVRGLAALSRLALMLASAALTMRLLPMPLLSAALAWWLKPLRRLGYDCRHLNLVLAVAAGTTPRTLAEASRLRDCLRLRMSEAVRGSCHGDGTAVGMRRGLPSLVGLRQAARRLRASWLAVPPLMEGLVRRAESLPLALVGRVPQTATGTSPLPSWQAFLLILWAVLLVIAVR